MFSAQRRDHHRRIALGARRNPAEPIHQPLEHAFLATVQSPDRKRWTNRG
jgi:hypothetical protein